MSQTHSLIAATGLTLLAACSTDSSHPLGTSARDPQPVGSPALAVERIRFQSKGATVSAFFTSTDPTGCIESSVFVIGGEDISKSGTGGPSLTGPGVFVEVLQSNSCTGTERLLDGGGPATLFEVNRRLTEASLQATITATDVDTGEEVPVQIDLAWTGTGDLLRQMGHEKFQLPGLVEVVSFRNVVREATATGSVVVGGMDLGPDPSASGFIARDAQLDVQRTIL
jgi:hypothetical protein